MPQFVIRGIKMPAFHNCDVKLKTCWTWTFIEMQKPKVSIRRLGLVDCDQGTLGYQQNPFENKSTYQDSTAETGKQKH